MTRAKVVVAWQGMWYALAALGVVEGWIHGWGSAVVVGLFASSSWLYFARARLREAS